MTCPILPECDLQNYTYYQVVIMYIINPTGSPCIAGSYYHSGVHEITPGFRWDYCCSILSSVLRFVYSWSFLCFSMALFVYFNMSLIPFFLRLMFFKKENRCLFSFTLELSFITCKHLGRSTWRL